MKKALYEIETTWTGRTYVRCYCWASSQEEVIQLYEAKYRDTQYAHSINRIQRLFNSEDPAFITEMSDFGWKKAEAG